MDHDDLEHILALLKLVELCRGHGPTYKNIGRIAAQELAEIESHYAPEPVGLVAEPVVNTQTDVSKVDPETFETNGRKV